MNDGPISGPKGHTVPPAALVGAGGGGGVESGTPESGAGPEAQFHARLQAMVLAGRYHGIELDPNEFRGPPSEPVPSAASLSEWAQCG